MSMRGVFVTGTDTDVGKTIVSAWLTHHWQADYWKPVQSGMTDGSDFDRIKQLVPSAKIHPSAYTLAAPLSPHEAAKLEGKTLKLEELVLPKTDNVLVVEGAGGAMVPLNDDQLMTDVMVHLGLPVVVVARSGLGTINHTLLTLSALRARGISVLGVVMNGPENPANAQAIEHFGAVKVLAQIPKLSHISNAEIAALSPPQFTAPSF